MNKILSLRDLVHHPSVTEEWSLVKGTMCRLVISYRRFEAYGLRLFGPVIKALRCFQYQ